MTSYTAITNAQIDPESPITTGLMTKMRDNPIAITEGAAGAPLIQTAALDAAIVTNAKMATNAIKRDNLDTTTGTITFPVTTSLIEDDGVLPGGQYGFYPRSKISAGAGTIAPKPTLSILQDMASLTTSFQALIGYQGRLSSGGRTISVEQRYVQSSPPYDLGDGDVPLFVYVRLNEDQSLRGIWIAPDPPWTHNGRHRVRTDYVCPKTKKPMMRCKKHTHTMADVLAKKISMQEFIMRRNSVKTEDVEVTMALKLQGMVDLPNPFVNKREGVTTFLLDPVSDLMHELAKLHEEGEDIGQLIHDGFVDFGSVLSRKTPPGIPARAMAWKNSK
jgi:hypothetical protein